MRSVDTDLEIEENTRFKWYGIERIKGLLHDGSREKTHEVCDVNGAGRDVVGVNENSRS